jgi:hypothetical protein
VCTHMHVHMWFKQPPHIMKNYIWQHKDCKWLS